MHPRILFLFLDHDFQLLPNLDSSKLILSFQLIPKPDSLVVSFTIPLALQELLRQA